MTKLILSICDLAVILKDVKIREKGKKTRKKPIHHTFPDKCQKTNMQKRTERRHRESHTVRQQTERQKHLHSTQSVKRAIYRNIA